MTLKSRFSFLFAGYTLLVLTLFGGTYYVFERQSILSGQRDEQVKTVEKVAAVCRAMYVASSPVGAINYFSVLRKEPAVVLAACVNPKGLIEAHSDPKMIGSTLGAEEADIPAGSNRMFRVHREIADGSPVNVLEWFEPVLVGDSRVGVAFLGFHAEILRHELREKLWATLRQLLIVAGCTFVLAVLIGLAMAWSVSQPIGGLVQTARRIGEGHFDYQTPLAARNDELGFLAKEMTAMAQRLRALDELKDEFVSSVSHDLRGPMAAIIMHMDFLLHMDPDKDKIPAKHQTILAMVMESAARLSVYVTNILDTAKMKAGRMEYRFQPVSLESIVADSRGLFSIMAKNREIALTTNVPENLPKVYADPERLEQVLANLLSNALKFTPPGGKVLIEAASKDSLICLSVADSGKGIPPEDLPKLFHAFGQLDVAEQKQKRIRGTGLGLFIVKQTVEAMGGKIDVQSQPQKGTRFTVWLRGFPGELHGKS